RSRDRGVDARRGVRRRSRAPRGGDGRRRDRRRRPHRRSDRRVTRVRTAGREDPRSAFVVDGRAARSRRNLRGGVVNANPVRVGPRTMVALIVASVFGVLAFLWPFFASNDSAIGASTVAPFAFGALLLLVLGVVLAQLSEGGLDAKTLALLGVLSALGAAFRPFGAGTAGVETIFFLLVIAGRALGPGFGFSLGCTTLFASALITAGVGPWMPYQMFACAWIGLGAGLLPRATGRREIWLLVAYTAAAAFLYGLLLNLSFWPFTLGADTQLSFVPGG